MRLQVTYHFAFCLTLPFYARTALVNVTVDDSGQDPFTGRTILYSPGWQAGDHCNNCLAHPNGGQLLGGTWHDSSFFSQPGPNDIVNQPSFANFTFSGTAIYVLCVLAQTTEVLVGNSDMTFYINGTIMNNFSKPAAGTDGYDYDVTVFSATSLPPGLHDLAIQNGHVDGPSSLMLLDAIVYTFDDGSRAPSPTPVGAIVGGVIGGLALLIVIILGLLWWRKRKFEHGPQQNIFRPFAFEPTLTPRSSSRHAKVSPLALYMMTPTGTQATLNTSGRGYADEPPAYESTGDVEPSSRSRSRSNDSAPPTRGVKRR